MLSALAGKKTIILGLLYALLSAFTGLTGWSIPGFQPDPDWLAHSITALMAVTAKVGLPGAMNFAIKMALDSVAPRLVEELRRQINNP